MLGVAIAAIAACCWGIVYAASQRLVAQNAKFTHIELLLISFMIGSIVLAPVFFYHNRSLKEANLDPKQILVFVATLMTAKLLVFYSVRLLGGTEASLIQVSYPLWTALDLYVMKGETPSNMTVMGAILIFSGIAYIVKYGEPHGQNAEGEGSEIQRSGDIVNISAKTSYSTI